MNSARRLSISLAAGAFFTLLLPLPAAPQSPAPPAGAATGRITGTVYEHGKEPFPFANVIVLGTKQGTMTDENGNFILGGVPVGAAQVQVQAVGYDKQVQ